jgi:hypothetical protein
LAVVQHPDYNADTVDNDIALLRIPTGEEDNNEFRSTNLFESDFDGTRNGRKINHGGRGRAKSARKSKKSSNSKFSSACLPEQGEALPEYDAAHCTIVGWGKEKNSHVYGTEVLHEAEVSPRFKILNGKMEEKKLQRQTFSCMFEAFQFEHFFPFENGPVISSG